MNLSIFREYDIRGVFEKELNENIVKKIGFFIAKKVLEKVSDAEFISIGYDARLHSPILKEWLVSGINYAGLEVLDMGLVPTPVNYFTNFNEIDYLETNASIMITGSHNPKEYNGFKITIDKKPFYANELYTLGEKVLNEEISIPLNHTTIEINAKEEYINYIVNQFSHLKLENKSFIFDCGNGTAGIVLKEILTRLNINHKILYENPDGNFPNHHPDPSEESTLNEIKKELETDKFDYAFAYDGDADRIALLSKKYNYKGDILAIFFSKFIKNPTVIGEVKCSQIMYDTINSYGKAIMYKTGHSNLKTKIKESNASFATEVSGHLYFNDRYFGYDDAIYTTLRILELVAKDFDFNKEFEKLPEVYSTPEINIDVTDENKFLIIEELRRKLEEHKKSLDIKDIITIDGIRIVFEDGWALVRASNTTPKLVTRFEASSSEKAKDYENIIMNLIYKKEKKTA